VTEGS